MVASGSYGKAKKRDLGEGEHDIEELSDLSDLRCGSERGPSALECVKFLRKSHLLPMPTTVVEKQQLIKDAIWAFADYPRLDP